MKKKKKNEKAEINTEEQANSESCSKAQIFSLKLDLRKRLNKRYIIKRETIMKNKRGNQSIKLTNIFAMTDFSIDFNRLARNRGQ